MKIKLAILSLILISSVGSLQAKKAKGGGGNKLDADNDGKVSKAEFVGGQKDKDKAEKKFSKLDKDSDGFLSKDELEGAKKKKKK